jgi:hypothetical protein
MAPAPARQPGDDLETPATHRLPAAAVLAGRRPAFPARHRIKHLADQLPPALETAHVQPHFRGAGLRPARQGVEPGVLLRMQRVGGQFAGHRQPVIDLVIAKPKTRHSLAEDAPRLAGAGRVERQRPSAATARREGGRTRCWRIRRSPCARRVPVWCGPSPPLARTIRKDPGSHRGLRRCDYDRGR